MKGYSLIVSLISIFLIQAATSHFVRFLPVNRFRNPFRTQTLNEPFPLTHVRRDIFGKYGSSFDGTTIYPILGLNTPSSILQETRLQQLASLRPYLNPTPLSGLVNPFTNKLAVLPTLNPFANQQRLRIYHARRIPANLPLRNSYFTGNSAFTQMPISVTPQLKMHKPVVLLKNAPNRHQLTISNSQHFPVGFREKLNKGNRNMPTAVPSRHLLPANLRFPLQETVLQKPPLKIQHLNQNMMRMPNIGMNTMHSSRSPQRNVSPATFSNFPVKFSVTSIPPRIQNPVPKFPGAMIQYSQNFRNPPKSLQLSNGGRTQSWTQIPTTFITSSSRGQLAHKGATKPPVLMVSKAWTKQPSLSKRPVAHINPPQVKLGSLSANPQTKTIRNMMNKNTATIRNFSELEHLPQPALLAQIEKAVEKGVEEVVSRPATRNTLKSKDPKIPHYYSPTSFRNNEDKIRFPLHSQQAYSDVKSSTINYPYKEAKAISKTPTTIKETPHTDATNQEQHFPHTVIENYHINHTDYSQILDSSEEPVTTDSKHYFLHLNQSEKTKIPEIRGLISNVTSYINQQVENTFQTLENHNGLKIDEGVITFQHAAQTPAYTPSVNRNLHSTTKRLRQENVPSSTIPSTSRITSLPVGTTRYSAYRKSNLKPSDLATAFGRRSPTTSSFDHIAITTTVKPVSVKSLYYENISRNEQNNESRFVHTTTEKTSKGNVNTFSNPILQKTDKKPASSIAPVYVPVNNENAATLNHRNKFSNRLTTRSKGPDLSANTENKPPYRSINTKNKPPYPSTNTENKPPYPSTNTENKPPYPSTNTENKPSYPSIETERSYTNVEIKLPYPNIENKPLYLSIENKHSYPNVENNRPYANAENKRPYPNIENKRPYSNIENKRPFPNIENKRPYPSTANIHPYSNVENKRHYPNIQNKRLYPSTENKHPHLGIENQRSNSSTKIKFPDSGTKNKHPDHSTKNERPDPNNEQGYPDRNVGSKYTNLSTERTYTDPNAESKRPNSSTENKNYPEPAFPLTKLLTTFNEASKVFGKRNITLRNNNPSNTNKEIHDLLMKQRLNYKPAESVQVTHSMSIFDKDINDRLTNINFRTLKPKVNSAETLAQEYLMTQPSTMTLKSRMQDVHPRISNTSLERSKMAEPYKNTVSVRKDHRVLFRSTTLMNHNKKPGEHGKMNESTEIATFTPSKPTTIEPNVKYDDQTTRGNDATKKIAFTNKTTVINNTRHSSKSNDIKNQTVVKEMVVDQETIMIDSLRSMKSRMQEVMSKGIRHMMPVLMTMGSDVELSSDCAFALLRWIRGMKSMEQWAVQMVDASSKIPEGILYGTISTFGSYDECLAIGSDSKSKVIMQGQYCSVSMQPLLPQSNRRFTIKDAFKNYPKLKKIFKEFKIDETTMAYYYILKHHVGLCVPAKCSMEDIANVAEKMEEEFKMNVTVNSCETATKVKFNRGQIISMTGVFVGLFAVAIATIFEWMLNRKSSSNIEHSLSNQMAERKISATRHFCSAFSAYLNSKQLLTTKLNSRHLPAIHGIKFLSICWIMLGHVYYCKDYLTIAGLSKVRDLGSNFAFQIILNSGFAADTFFVISGLLVVYTTLLHLKKTHDGFSIVSFYLKRYSRLTPAILLASGLVFLGPLAGSGPLWKETLQPFVEGCEKYWWTNLFYFSNFIPTAQTCVPHGWFVSCDFQFYIISPIVILALHRQPKFGMFLITLGMIISAAAVGILTFVLDLPPTSLFTLPDPKDIHEFLDTIGYKPYTHYAAYCVGMATGSFLVSNRKIKIPKLTQLLGWCISTAVCCCVVYGTWLWNSGELPDWIVSVTYAATCRTAWSLGVAWLIIVCVSGHGGIVNDILSWRGFVPLSRLSYMAYLIHPLLMYVYASYVRSPFYFSQYVVVYLYLGHVCATFGLSFILSITFEIPFLNLEKIISKQLSQSRTARSQNAAPQQSRRHLQHPDHPKIKEPVILVRQLPERHHYL